MRIEPVALLRRPRPRIVRVGISLLTLSGLVAGVAIAVRLPLVSPWSRGVRGFALFAVLFALYGLGVWLISSLSSGWARTLTLGGAVATQLAAFTARPRFSDDLYRYVWDGRVQAHGIDPYRSVPMASQLAPLRTSQLFPPSAGAVGHCVLSGPGITAGCTLLNRPLVHTIYPPVAEAYFWLIHGAGPKGVQVFAAAFAVLVTVVLLWGLPRVGGDARQAVLWAWCPTVAIEAGNGGHVDVVAVFLTACALLILGARRAFSSARAVVGGAFLGLAVVVKVTPVLAVPGASRRRPLPLLASLVGVVVVVYFPHVVAVGTGVTGFLSGYLSEEGYDSGRRFAVLDLVMPRSWTSVAAFVVLAVSAAVVWWRSDACRPWRGALVMTGVALIVAAPGYPWYAELLVLVVAFTGWQATAWLTLALAGYVVQADGRWGWSYAVAGGVVAVAALARRYQFVREQRSRPGTETLIPVHPSCPVDVILPCLNEAGALPFVLGRMPAGYRPIVVDNGSSDGSPAIAVLLGARVVLEPRRGFGAACQAGLEAATADVVCFLDCDGSFDPADLPKVAGPVLAGQVDLCLGQRRPTCRGAWPPHARLANRLLALRIHRATGVRLRDLGPMRAARREALLGLGIVDRRFGYPLEMVLKAVGASWRIGETDVPYAPRTGKSKVTGTIGGTIKAITDMRRVWKAATQ